MKTEIGIKPSYLEIVEKIKELCATEKDFTEKTRDLISFIGKIDVEKEVYYLKKYWSYT